MARSEAERAQGGALPAAALVTGWLFGTAIMVGVGATHYQQTRELFDLYVWLAAPVLFLILLGLLAAFGALAQPKPAPPEPRPTHLSRHERTYGRR